MKKVVVFFSLYVLSFSAAFASLILQESFDGKNGEIGQLCVGATNTEDFFNGASYEETHWWSYSGSSNYIQIAEGSLSYKEYQNNGVGNKAYLWSTGADDLRSFASKAVNSGKIYLGAIINVEALKQKTDPDYFLSLGDHANSYFLGRLYAKTVKDGDNYVGYKLGIAKNNESATYLRYTEQVFEENTNLLIVIEYEFVEGEKNDIVRLYVDPNKNTTVPTLVAVSDTITGGGIQQGADFKPDAGKNGIFAVFIRQGLSTPKIYIDEIKVTTAWEDLWTDEPENPTTQFEDVETINQNSNISQPYKIIKNGQLLIIHDEKIFNALGTEIR